jgi:hemolysin III
MKPQYVFPSYTRPELIADGFVHAASVTFALGATVFLLAAAFGKVSPAKFAGAAIYCTGLTFMFGASAAYNLVANLSVKEVLRRLDHAAIFIMIAGSYTPFALAVGGDTGRALLIAVWAIAFAGAALKLRFPRRFDKLSVLLYLAQGWIVIFALNPIVSALPGTVCDLLLAGGIVYTLGVPFHLMEWMRFHNVIWHGFVLGGAACQYIAIQGAVIP